MVDSNLLRVFRLDAQKAVVVLRETAASGDIKLFTTTAHAMKSALANVKEHEASGMAAALETAGLNKDTDFIAANLSLFIEKLELLIKTFASDEPSSIEDTNVTEDLIFLAEQLRIVKTACEGYDDEAAYTALDRLKEKPYKAPTLYFLVKIRDMLFLASDFDGAAQIIRKFEEELQ